MKTNEVLENIKARRSVRAYTGQQVLEEDLQAILEAATYAPSGMHLETWHFTAIQNMDKLTELNERIKGAFAKSDDSRLQERGHSKTYCCYYHAPTLSFPVHGTLMIEPTESESLAELDNFVDVMLNIWKEIQEVKNGEADKDDNVLINAPHPEYEIINDRWEHSYTREKAAYPIESVRDNKFWINVARVDNTLGDRKLLPTRYGTFE